MKTILVDALHTFIIKGQGIFKEMCSLLEEYPNTKIILTNADDKQMDIFGLSNLPYRVFTLKHNPDKTNPNYYKIMIKELSLEAEELLYFEHDLKSVEAARSVGINTYHYNSEQQDLNALKIFLDQNI
jgi:HAD superfamily hydrolase (TIGR01509 family)